MPTTDEQQTANQKRQERFEQYNPYANAAANADVASRDANSMLAVAYEIAALRADIRFSGKRRSES